MRSLGRFVIFMAKLFTHREPFKVYVGLFFDECIRIGIDSIFIVAVVSVFIGGVTCVQTVYNLVSPLIPLYVVGLVVRDMMILEIAPTFTAVVFAGKVGSNIAGGLGTMRITEQIDALEVMGINSISYLVLPKILAAMVMYPMLVILAGFLGILGGYAAGVIGDLLTAEDYIYGIRSQFNPFSVKFAIIKSVVFALLIASISAFQGYYTKGGALEVGQSSTNAVTHSCIAVLIADFLLARLLV
ncbi:MAG: ABC transporter permease [Flammeovirgaceae bacterium]|nr:ABC transporter permease [Flammeovirgaceae bacterium]